MELCSFELCSFKVATVLWSIPASSDTVKSLRAADEAVLNNVHTFAFGLQQRQKIHKHVKDLWKKKRNILAANICSIENFMREACTIVQFSRKFSEYVFLQLRAKYQWVAWRGIFHPNQCKITFYPSSTNGMSSLSFSSDSAPFQNSAHIFYLRFITQQIQFSIVLATLVVSTILLYMYNAQLISP